MSDPRERFVSVALVARNRVANKLVEVAFVVVLFIKSASAKCEVDEAKMPLCAHRIDVVAAVSVP